MCWASTPLSWYTELSQHGVCSQHLVLRLKHLASALIPQSSAIVNQHGIKGPWGMCLRTWSFRLSAQHRKLREQSQRAVGPDQDHSLVLAVSIAPRYTHERFKRSQTVDSVNLLTLKLSWTSTGTCGPALDCCEDDKPAQASPLHSYLTSLLS